MPYSYLDFAEEILAKSEKPLTYQDIWQKGEELNFVSRLDISGKTPWASLGSRLFVDVKNNPNSRFIKVGKNPARFFLTSRNAEISPDIIQKIEIAESKIKTEETSFNERDLHALLTYFVYANPSFGRGKNIFTKTIYHEISKKKGYNEWLHPDMVGFYIPLDDWNPNLIEFNRLSDNNVLKLFSFEIKKIISRSNYRESYFQAVSNSSWANEGYLVSAEVIQDDDLLAELERLNASFGIGIIQLDLNDIDSSSVLFPAKIKTNLGWETMNKLCEQNSDFDKFIQDVKIDFESKRIHKSEYDEIIESPEDYIKKLLHKSKK
ncbi:MAG: HTH domain-containing protein [Ignavibacteriaceae bacterium]